MTKLSTEEKLVNAVNIEGALTFSVKDGELYTQKSKSTEFEKHEEKEVHGINKSVVETVGTILDDLKGYECFGVVTDDEFTIVRYDVGVNFTKLLGERGIMLGDGVNKVYSITNGGNLTELEETVSAE